MGIDVSSGYDVFVSYSSRDRPVVEPIARRLRDAGLAPWFDRWALTAGRSWQEEIAAGVAGSGACAVCIGPGDIGDWSREELEIALVRAANDRGFRVFVVLLPGVGDVPALSPFLVTRTWVDLRGGVGDLQPLVNAVRGVPAGAPSPVVQAKNPYRGLRPFEEDDADSFFGRDAEIQQALEKLRTARFLAVVGASGSGKSSLVRAGIVPALRGSGTWTVEMLKPGATPLETLAVHLAGADVRAAREQLRTGVDGLHLLGRVALADAPDDARLLVVVDQFEEVFTRCRDEDERRRFTENLAYAATAPDGRIVIVLTLRADFYPRCAAYPELGHLLTTHQSLLGPMDADSLRDAIETPARAAGGEFEAGLVDLLLDEVSGRPGALPLLEHTLYELWEHRAGRMLTLEAYQRAGGVSGAVAHRAEAVFNALDADEQAITRRVLLRLTEPGEGTEDTRRRAELDELARTASEAGAVTHVVGALADARLLTTSEGVVDVAHEALIRGWPRLRGWIDEDRDRLRVHRRLSETAEEWERLDRDPGLLFRGVRLAQARALDAADLNERERAFLDASGAQERSELEQVHELARSRQRATRRLLFAAAILLVGVVVSSIAAIWALRARDDAQQQATVALARQLIVQSRETATDRLDTAALHSLAAWKLSPDDETEAALADLLRTDPRLTVLRPSGPALVALRADARTAVGVDAAGGVTRWDLVRRRAVGETWRLPKPASAAISGDLRTLAAAGDDGRVQLWDVATGTRRGAPQRVADGELYRLELDRAGTHLVATDDALAASLWAAGPPWRRLRVGEGPSDQLAIAPDGRRAAVVPEFGRGRVVSVPDGRRLAALPPDALGASFTDDGRRLIAELEQANDVRSLQGRRLWRSAETPMAYGPDGARVVNQAANGDLSVENSEEDSVAPALGGLDLGDAVVAFAGDAQVLATGSDGALGLWSLAAGQAFRDRYHRDVSAVSPDGRTAASWTRDHGLTLIDLPSDRTTAQLELPAGVAPEVVAVSPGGRWAASTAESDLWLSDRRRGGAPAHVRLGASAAGLGFSRAGTLMVVGTDKSLVTFDVGATWPPKPRRVVAGSGGDTGVAAIPVTGVSAEERPLFLPDERHVLSLDRLSRRVLEFDLKAGTVRTRAEAHALAVAADGRSAATVASGGQVSVWRLPAWSRNGAPVTREPFADTLALSSDGRRLAVSAHTRDMTVWDTVTRARVRTVDATDVSAMAWDGDRLVSVNGAGVYRWDLSLAGLLRRACAVANRDLSRAEWRAIAGADRPYARLCPPRG